uniref:Enhancer of mRNA-decapping protein 3 n=1 Tax=Blastobotrys adeninivorans TaxID=409370 RepID=A0A060T2X8_BLAAD
MAQFIGKSVRLTLNDKSQVTGLVSNVVDGTLSLTSVHFVNTGKVVDSAKFAGPQIADLDIISSRPPSVQPSAPPPAQTPFVDPAIVSAAPIVEDSSESEVNEDPYTAEEFRQKAQAQKRTKKKRNQTNNNQKNNNNNQNNHQNNHHYNNFTNNHNKGGQNWATEDASDIKNHEFDFQANLNLFDKQSVFEQIRQNDHTLPGHRLVEHNRVNPQQKYGNLEMVIPRKSSLQMGPIPNSGYSFLLNSQPCPTATPLQLVELERASSETHGVPEVVITENAGRGIAQLALRVLGGSSRFTVQNHNAHPLAVVMVGNTSAGSRAIAACRHLMNRRVYVVAVLTTDIESAIPELQRQLVAFKAAKGVVISNGRLESLVSILSQYDSPPELIIDGLQGYREDLLEDTDDSTQLLGLIDWANRAKASVLSIDMPAGLDPTTGLAFELGSVIQPKWVVSCGLPLTGLLNASSGEWTHFLIDIGFPIGAMKRRFAKVWFGHDWVAELQIGQS